MRVTLKDVWDAYTFFFRRPEGMAEWLKLSLLMLIPVVGWAIVIHHRVDLASDIDRYRDDRHALPNGRISEFDWQWKSLFSCLVIMTLFLIVGPMSFILSSLILGYLYNSNGFAGLNNDQFVLVVVICLVSGTLISLASTQLIAGPALLYQMFTQTIRIPAMVHTIWKFTYRCPGEFVFLVLAKFSMDLFLLVICVMSFGILLAPVLVVINFADQCLMANWYQAYLETGGQPIPGSPSAIRAMR